MPWSSCSRTAARSDRGARGLPAAESIDGPRSLFHPRPAPSSPGYGDPRISRRGSGKRGDRPGARQGHDGHPLRKGPFGRQRHRLDPAGRPVARGGTAGRRARVPGGSQIRMPRVKTAIRRVSEIVRRTRSIVGMPRSAAGAGAVFAGRIASRLPRVRSLVRGLSMVTIGDWGSHRDESVAAMRMGPT